MPQAPGSVQWVARTLEDAGYETWTVGGAVRNTLLGLPTGDWDLTTRAPPTVVQRLFPRTVAVGVEHGTVGVLTRNGLLLEVTTFRRDVETFGRHAVVEFADTLDEDLARRDFTVNAIAWHPLRQEFRDPFRGREDLKAAVLRTVGEPRERFAEDYLRILRALRFSGRFRFRIEKDTWLGLCEATPSLTTLSPERTREELMKILSQDSRPSGSLSLYAASGSLAVLYPELESLRQTRRPGRDEDLWTHAVLLVDLLPLHRPTLRLAGLLHGLGIPGSDSGRSSGPGTRGRERAAALLFRGRFSNAEIQTVASLVGMGPEPPMGLVRRAALRRWLHDAGPQRVRDFSRLWLAKARLDRLRWNDDPDPVLDLITRLRKELEDRPPLRLEDLAVSGRDLIAMGLKPGPRFGRILDDLMDRVLENPALNDKDTLMKLVASTVGGSEVDR